jgi:hypothetical protein
MSLNYELTKIKDWKSCVVTWKKNQSKFGQSEPKEQETWIEKVTREAQEKTAAKAVGQ